VTYDFVAVHCVVTVEGQDIVFPNVTVIEPDAWPSDVNAPETSSDKAADAVEYVKAPLSLTGACGVHPAVSSPRQGLGNDT
jgi:hypothetical protein